MAGPRRTCRGLGWVAFDPTACICPDARYVRVAVGFDARDGDLRPHRARRRRRRGRQRRPGRAGGVSDAGVSRAHAAGRRLGRSGTGTCATALALHSCSLGAPILLEEAEAAGVQPKPVEGAATPAIDKIKAIGQWNVVWESFLALDPGWTDAFMGVGAGIYGSGALSPKEIELLSIAFDASFTQMYAPGTRRHIQNALRAGAAVEEIFEVLKICVGQGAQAINLGVPILEEELAARGSR